MKGRLRPLAIALPLALAGLTASPAARAFCGFYVGGADAKLFNNATMVVLMRDGMRTVLSMQNNYQGPPDDFAMVVPVPIVLQKENVKTLPRDVFQRVDTLAAPRLVEYWEQDPCTAREKQEGAVAAAPLLARAAPAPPPDGALGVKIEAQFTVGEYEVVILSAQDSSGLDTWLRQNRYKIPDGAEPILRPYVAAGMKFFVAKVDAKKVAFENGQAMLSPLRFHYDSDAFSLPVRLGLLNSNGTQDLIVHILARGKRYEVTNYPNVTIPTNYDVAEDAKDRFGEFYAALFDKTVEANPGAVVTEYSWDAQSCDPCPTPPLAPMDIATLGADALTPPETTATNPSFVATTRIGDVKSTGVVQPEGRFEVWKQIFQTCYTASLKQSASPRGKVNVTLKLDDKGAVTDVKTVADKGIPETVPACIAIPLRRGRFAVEPGAGNNAQLSLSIQFDVRAPEPGEQGWYHPPLPSLYGFTLTRLHARYGKDALGQDLVFKEAPGIVGGREDFGAKQQQHGAQPAGMNNFQGRYIIRHPWTGPITCANPERGIWGGPPGGTGTQQPLAAKNTAFAPRGKITLASLLREPVPEIKLTPNKPSPSAEGGQAKGCGGCAVESSVDARIPSAFAVLLGLALGARRRRRHAR